MKHLKIILAVSLFLNVVTSIFVGQKIYRKCVAKPTVVEKAPDTVIKYWLNRQELFEVLPKKKNAIVFLGNSLTQHFEVAEIFKNPDVQNRGINGDNIPGVLNRLSPIIESQPKSIFIEIGINDLGHGAPKERVLENYKKLLDTLKKECKSTRIYVQSIFPVANKSESMGSYCSPKVNDDIIAINNELAKYSKLNDIVFLDFYQNFEADGELNPKFSVDGVHLSGDAYILWAKLLSPYLNK